MRDINKIIIHCSATPEGKEVTVEDIDRWHRAQGWNGIGYHYVIYLDGSIHNGRPIEQIGSHCKGHNRDSIGVCYIGGVDLDGRTPKDTRTYQQKASMKLLVDQLKLSYPGATVHGHNEFASKACPSFNVRQEILNGLL